MGDEDAEAEGEVELFGVLRLPLASGTASGYVGVRHVAKSKKRPWQAWVKVKGDKRRRCLGSFKSPQEGAVARARALACGPDNLPSPRKQAARNSGAVACHPCMCTFLLLLIPILTCLDVLCSPQSNDQQPSRQLAVRFLTSKKARTFGVRLCRPALQAACRPAPQLRVPLACTAHHIRYALLRRFGHCCQASLCHQA